MHIAQLPSMALCVVEPRDAQQPAIHLQDVASAQLHTSSIGRPGAAEVPGCMVPHNIQPTGPPDALHAPLPHLTGLFLQLTTLLAHSRGT